MMRASVLLVWLVVATVLALGDKLERRAPPMAPAIEVPVREPACPRLAPMASRVDLVVIDHVLVFRCASA